MFFVPRDYSAFDYVIGTLHATYQGFDTGILIEKSYTLGKKAYNLGFEYLKRSDIILKRSEKTNLFKTR